MRILFCNYEYPPLGGGGGVINALLAQELAKRHEVTILTSRALGLPAENVEHGIRIIRVPVLLRRQEAVASLSSMLSFMLMGTRTGKKLLASEKYDVINSHFVLPSGPVGDALSRFAGIPHVLTLLGGDVYDPSKFFSPHRHPVLRKWIRLLLKRADAVVGDSQNVLENMGRFYTTEIAGVRIPLGIKMPQINVVPREHYGFSREETLLVTVGRLIQRKALPQLIAMMERLREAAVRLLILGSGPEESNLRAEVQRRQLGAKVFLFGHVNEAEKFRILRACDIYVSTSQHEGFGLVFLEAMACELPIVCYDNGGQTDFLQEGKTGFLVPLNNRDAFTKRCELLCSNAGLRKVIGENNRRRVEQFYIDQCALRYENLFYDVLATRTNGKGTRRTFRGQAVAAR
jgi:glycosyltransferase involved in cell wall biosynthesis